MDWNIQPVLSFTVSAEGGCMNSSDASKQSTEWRLLQAVCRKVKSDQTVEGHRWKCVHRVQSLISVSLCNGFYFCFLTVIIQNNNKSEFSSGFKSKLQTTWIPDAPFLQQRRPYTTLFLQIWTCDALQLLLKPAILLPWHLS